LWLVKNGVPYDKAFDLDDVERLAHAIIFGEYEGNIWDWSAMRWRNDK
jgi:hypothetical protein